MTRFHQRLRLKIPHLDPKKPSDIVQSFREIDRFAMDMLGPKQKYTPVWDTTGDDPTLGDAVLEGWWREIGDMVFANIYFEYGSTSATGTGTWSFTLPFRSDSDVQNQSIPGWFVDAGGATADRRVLQAPMAASDTTVTVQYDAGFLTGANNPIGAAWAAGDKFHLTGFYFT
jgi:hypothetical protein